MTDFAFYDELNALALELMTDFGTPATLRKINISKPNAEGKVVKTPQDSPGLAVQTLNKLILDQLAEVTEVALVYKGPGQPVIGAHLHHGGNVWEIKDFKLVNPRGDQMIVAFLGCIKP